MSAKVRLNIRRIKVRMAELGLNQGDIAKKLGKPQCTVSAWLSGRHNPCLKQLKALADLLGINLLSDLVEVINDN